MVTAIESINLQDPTPIAGVPNGLRDTETDYVPNVVRSENGLASFEALKAQAVAARTFAYFQMQVSGSIDNGTNDQVYKTSASNSPSAIHLAAALATEGEVLTHPTLNAGDVLASFYVAAGIPTAGAPLNDLGSNIGSDPTGTEGLVTYNLGLTGAAVQPSSQGSASNPRNRGTMSQNGGDFLSDNSVHYLDILKYYYGADIQVEVALPTVGSASTYSVKSLTDFDNFGSGRTSDGIIDGSEGVFGWSPTLSGSNANLSGATADRSGLFAQAGTHSQQIDIDYDESSGGDFLLRHVAGSGAEFTVASNIANATGNVLLETVGSVGFWLLTDDPGLEVSLALDDPSTGDRGIRQAVTADGDWHKYEWFLEEEDQWEAWIGAGNGIIDGPQFSLDSIQFFGSADSTVYLDSVFWDPSAVFVPQIIPEPGTLMLLVPMTLAAVRRRRPR